MEGHLEKPFPAYSGDEPYIFVCYAHEDDRVVYPEIQWLGTQGINVWYDEGISPGEEWSEELGRAIENAERLVIFVTPNSAASRHCRNEVHFAQNHNTPILAVHLQETQLPRGLELAMGSSQAILGHHLEQTVYRSKLLQALGAPADHNPAVPTSGARNPPESRATATYIAAAAFVVVALVGFALWRALGPDLSDGTGKANVDRTHTGPSIAVLPFANRSIAQENAEFLAEGIHDEILTQLGGIQTLKVISRTSMLAYRGTSKNLRTIGDELGVAAVLEGSVQRAGDTVRINAKLIDADNETQLWADTYDRTLTAANLFAIQHEISMAIAGALATELSASTKARLTSVPTDDLAALEAYFKGKQLLEIRTSESLLSARSYFQEAIDRDPAFAHAYAGLAEAWLELPNYTADMDPQAVRDGASRSARQATALNAELPEALAALGWQLLLHEFDWEGAEAALRKALVIQPNNVNALHWSSHVLSWQGNHEQALALADRAAEIDPLSTLISRNLGYIHMDAGHFDTAVAIFEAVLEQDPYSSGLENLWTVQLRAGYVDAAVETLELWGVTRGRDQRALGTLTQALLEREQTGRAVNVTGETIAQLALTLSDQAQVYAALGDRDATLTALERSFEVGTHSRSLLSTRINPSFDFVRSDNRFKALLNKIGLAQQDG